MDARRRAIGSAIHKLFETGVLGGGDLPTVGIWSMNCPSMSRIFMCDSTTLLYMTCGLTDWQVVDLALQAYAKVGVSLYNTLGKDSAGMW